MKHVLIGMLLGIIVLLLGGCTSAKGKDWHYNSPFESFAKVFKPSEWKGPITGDEARYARARFVAETTGNVSRLNRLAYEDDLASFPSCQYKDFTTGWDGGEMMGVHSWWSSSRGGYNLRDAQRPHYYSYMGKLYRVPVKGSFDYDRYIWRTRKK